MRNLKRVLSLALACVMVIGMMVMTTGAADFDDADEIKYAEAVDVANALGIIEGYTVGDASIYNPDGALYRDQGAKFIAYLLLGAEGAELLKGTATGTMFTDVPADLWSAPYVEYCANLKIVGGWDGKFAPGGELLGWQFGKMLLVALGNDADECGYNGGNYLFNIVADMTKAGLVLDGVDVNAVLTRQQAAQMLLIALKAPIGAAKGWYYQGMETSLGYFESYTDAFLAAKTIIDGDGNDATVFNAAKVLKDTSSNTLLNKLYKVTYKGTDVDAYGRPGVGYEKTVDGKKVIDLFFVDTPVATFTSGLGTEAGVKVVKAALEGYKLSDTVKVTDKTAKTYTNLVLTDGVAGNLVVATNKTGIDAIAALTKDTNTVEIYADSDKIITEIVVVNTYADTVSKVNPAEGETKANIELTGGVAAALTTIETDKFAQGDVVLYTKAVNAEDATKYDVVTIEVADSFTGTLTGYTKDNKFTINGDVYEVSGITGVLTSNGEVAGFIGEEMVYHLDANGDIIEVTAPKGAEEAPIVITNYAIVLDAKGEVKSNTAKWPESGTYYTVTAKIQVLLSDGTVEVWDVPVLKADKAIVVGEVDTDGGESNDIAKGDFYYYLASKTPTKVVIETGEGKTDTTNSTLLTTALKVPGVYTHADKALVAAVDTLAGTEDEDATVQAVNKANIGATSYTAVSKTTEKTIILNDKTVFVLKAKAPATGFVVKTGLTALEKSTITADKALIITDVTAGVGEDGKSDTTKNVNVATLVFAAADTFEKDTDVAKTDDYVFVDANYAVSMDGEDEIHTYSVIYADGTTGSIAMKDADDGATGLASGVYKLMANGSINTTDGIVAGAGTKLTVKLVSGTTVIFVGEPDVAMTTTDKTVVIGGELAAEVEAYVVATSNVIEIAFIVE